MTEDEFNELCERLRSDFYAELGQKAVRPWIRKNSHRQEECALHSKNGCCAYSVGMMCGIAQLAVNHGIFAMGYDEETFVGFMREIYRLVGPGTQARMFAVMMRNAAPFPSDPSIN